MAGPVYENPFVGRFHSTLKNDYLIPWGVNSTSQLEKALPRYEWLYNHERPHQSLGWRTPVGFEALCSILPVCQRTILKIKLVKKDWPIQDFYLRGSLGLSGLKVRGIKHFEKLVFHSDGGGQYLDKNFLKILARRHIESGMAGPV